MSLTYFSYPNIKLSVHMGAWIMVLLFSCSSFDLLSVYYSTGKNHHIKVGRHNSSSAPALVEMFLSVLGQTRNSIDVCVLFCVLLLNFLNTCNFRQNSRTWQTVPRHLLSLGRSSLNIIWWVMYFLSFMGSVVICRAFLEDFGSANI